MVGAPLASELTTFPGGWALGLALLLLSGDGLLRILRRARILDGPDYLAAWGLRLLLGLAGVPWICMGLDLLGIAITRLSLGLCMVGLAGLGLLLRRKGQAPDAPPVRLWRSPAALVLTLVLISLVLFSAVQCIVFPPRAYDALVGFDVVGKILAHEGRLRSSIFTQLEYNAQTTYPPFASCNQGFWYLFHPATPRLWVPLLLTGFLGVAGAWIHRATRSPTATTLALFMMLILPEVTSHLTLGQTDLPCMVFMSLAFFAVANCLRGENRLPSAGLYMLLAMTTRGENLLFAIALSLPLLARYRWRVAWLLLPAAGGFALWNLLYVKTLIGYDAARHFRTTLELDAARAGEVLSRALDIIARPDGAFGGLVWLILALPLLWAAGRWGGRRGWWPAGDATGPLLLLLAVAFLFYMPYFYQWDPQLNPLWTMEHTFKRGFFRFVPGILAAFVAAPPILALLRHCDERK